MHLLKSGWNHPCHLELLHHFVAWSDMICQAQLMWRLRKLASTPWWIVLCQTGRACGSVMVSKYQCISWRNWPHVAWKWMETIWKPYGNHMETICLEAWFWIWWNSWFVLDKRNQHRRVVFPSNRLGFLSQPSPETNHLQQTEAQSESTKSGRFLHQQQMSVWFTTAVLTE